MKKIILVIISICVCSNIYSQTIDSIKHDTIKSILSTNIDSIQFESIRKIEERYNSFYAKNRQSQTFYVIGIGFATLATVLKNQLDSRFVNITYGIAGASALTGLGFYLDSFNYFNSKKKDKKKAYFIRTW